MWWEILYVLIAVLVALVAYVWIGAYRMKDFWSSRGFASMTQKELGNGFTTMFKGIHVTILDTKLYKVLKSKGVTYAGFIEFNKPAFVTSDVEVMRSIFVKDFDHFVDRRDFPGTENDEWSTKMLFFMRGEPWKELRSKMSPTFTTGKIRRMFAVLENSSQRMVKFLQEECQKSSTQDMTVGFGKYTVDVISSAAFGLESGAFREKKSMFEIMAEKLQFNVNLKAILKFITILFAPRIANLLRLAFFDQVACLFFSGMIRNTIKHRKTTGEKRDDFLQLMLEASAGQLKADEASELDTFEKEAAITTTGKKLALTEDVICAQSILFFLAGFDTTQSLLQFAAYQLAVCPEIQEILAEEVIQAYSKNDGAFTYESINEMEYMDKFVSETLRMFPPVPRLDRKCNKDLPIAGTNLVIPAGTIVIIPTYAIHHDKEVYPDPFRFDPERFSKEAKAARSPYNYMPFGHGPRNCIGMRFALTEAKLGIAHLVQNFVLEPTEKTPIPMKFAMQGTLKPDGGVWLNVRPRDKLPQ